MKSQISTTLVAAAIAYAISTQIAAAKWDETSQDYAWSDYCTMGGARHGDPAHVCVQSGHDITAKVASQTGFRGLYNLQDARGNLLMIYSFLTTEKTASY